VSSLTNFAVVLYVARAVGPAQFGAFSLAYVTYGFALNASRGLATDPLLVRFSGADLPAWRAAVARCTGTAAVVGMVTGACVLGAAALLDGTAKGAFLALGLTLPGLLLQDSWRYAFFALGRGRQAFLNDMVWGLALLPALAFLRETGQTNVSWFVFAWGAAATVAAAVGPLQARVVPRLAGTIEWVSQHRDLGPRYLAENTSNSASIQLRSYGVGLILGLAAVGYVQAATTLMGPFMVIFFGMNLVAVPEGARALRRSPRHLRLFCLLLSGGLALAGLAWGVILLVALPRGLGHWLLGPIWRPTYPLVLPLTISVLGSCVTAGASGGLHALGASRRSMRTMVLASAIFLVCGLVGAVAGGAVGTVRGAAVATWIGALLWWWQLRAALQEFQVSAGDTAIERQEPSVVAATAAEVTATVSSPIRSRRPRGDAIVDPTGRSWVWSDRALVVYAKLLGPLLLGYLLFDKAFAYIHIPGTPVYVGEMVLVVGAIGALAATGYLRLPVAAEPILALLAAFFLWGLIRVLPGYHTYGIFAVRDFALVYYCLFAFLTVAALARSPDMLDRWIRQLERLVPLLLIWLPISVLLAPLVRKAPHVPGTAISVLTHKAGNIAIAAFLVLGYMWLFREKRSARSRAFWSIIALATILLAGTQNRGGMVGVVAGSGVGLLFIRDRLSLIIRAVMVLVLGLSLAALLSLKVPAAGGQGRTFSASQVITNVASIVGVGSGGALQGTVQGRDQLWSLLYHEQVNEGRLIEGFGFGMNLAYLVGDSQVTNGPDPLRSPHNSHLDVLSRTGLVGLSLWIALWLGWYRRLVVGCRRLAQRGLHVRRRVAVLCLMVTTAILVSSYFDPQLEGAQVAALLWTAFAVGVAVTSFRGWFSPTDVTDNVVSETVSPPNRNSAAFPAGPHLTPSEPEWSTRGSLASSVPSRTTKAATDEIPVHYGD